MSTTRPTAAEATDAWRKRVVKAHESTQDDAASQLATVYLLEELAKGKPVTRTRAAELLGVSKEEIDDLFEAIDAGGGQLNEEGEFIGMALTLKPTRHSLQVNDNHMFAWCSLDTILIPGILETEGEVESTDPLTGETIRLTVTADRIARVEPPGAVTSIFVPGKTPTETGDSHPVAGEDSEVCTSMLFYASRENAEEALAGYPNIAIFTIEEAFNLARATWTEPTRSLRKQAAARKTA